MTDIDLSSLLSAGGGTIGSLGLMLAYFRKALLDQERRQTELDDRISAIENKVDGKLDEILSLMVEMKYTRREIDRIVGLINRLEHRLDTATSRN
jgi:peptidoglycan hydrolase CwlO-like protein